MVRRKRDTSSVGIMAYLKDTWDWAALETELKDYLGITGSSEDANLQKLLLAALRAGDQFCNNPWTISDTPEYMWGTESGDDVIPPDDVKLGVFEWMRENRARIALPIAPSGTTPTTRKTGDLSEGYALHSRPWEAGGPPKTWRDYWYPYRMDLFL